MERDIALALNHVLKRFHDMEFDKQTLDYLEMEINDMIYRVYPDFGAEYHIFPRYYKDEQKIKFLSIRKH